MVDKKAKSLKAADNPIRRLSQREHRTVPGRQQQGKERCSRCGRTNHAANNCKFSDATCHNCGKKGHIATACRSNKSRKSSKYQQQHHSTKYVDANSDDSGPDEIQLHAVGSSTKSSPPIMVNVQVQGEDLPMEVDTGAAVSIISETTWKNIFPNTELSRSDLILSTYSNEHLTVVGERAVDVVYGKQKAQLVLIIVAGSGPTLFGRNWLQHLRLDWKRIAVVTTPPKQVSLSNLLAEHPSIFRGAGNDQTLPSYSASTSRSATKIFQVPLCSLRDQRRHRSRIGSPRSQWCSTESRSQ